MVSCVSQVKNLVNLLVCSDLENEVYCFVMTLYFEAFEVFVLACR